MLTNKTRIKGVATSFRNLRPAETDEEWPSWLEFVTLTGVEMADEHRKSFVEACKNDRWEDVVE